MLRPLGSRRLRCWNLKKGLTGLLLGLLFALLELPHAWCMLLHKFLAPQVDHWCKRPQELAHWTQEEWSNFSLPAGDSCHIYNRSQETSFQLSYKLLY